MSSVGAQSGVLDGNFAQLGSLKGFQNLRAASASVALRIIRVLLSGKLLIVFCQDTEMGSFNGLITDLKLF